MRAATASVVSLAEIRRNLSMLRVMLRRGKNRPGREGVDRTQQNARLDRLSDGNARVMKAVSL